MAKTVRVHVTYCETKRILSPLKGSEVKELRYIFLQVFSDVLADQVSPADVTFQRYDDGFKDYVEIDNDEKIKDELKLRALVCKKAGSTQSDRCKNPWWPCPNWVIDCTSPCGITITPGPSAEPTDGFIRPHSVKQNQNYRLWSPVSRQNAGLIRRDSSNNIVTCDGSFEGDINTLITTSSISRNLVSLIFKDRQADKQYAMKAEGEGNNIKTIEFSGQNDLGSKSRFEAFYFWSYTMFRNEHYETLYLGCDSSGKATLVTNSDLDYPNPQALFILNKVVLAGPSC